MSKPTQGLRGSVPTGDGPDEVMEMPYKGNEDKFPLCVRCNKPVDAVSRLIFKERTPTWSVECHGVSKLYRGELPERAFE